MDWSTKPLLVFAIVFTMMAFAGNPGAMADPVANPGAASITQTCNGVDYQFVVRHAGVSDQLPASAHIIGSSGVGILKTTDVEVFVEGAGVVDSFSLEWRKTGQGIAEDRIVTCTNVIPIDEFVTIFAHNTMVFPPGWDA